MAATTRTARDGTQPASSRYATSPASGTASSSSASTASQALPSRSVASAATGARYAGEAIELPTPTSCHPAA